MKRIIHVISALILLLFAGISQAANIGFGSYTFSKDTLNYGDTLVITTHVVNFGTSTFNDSISFVFEVNNIQNIDTKLFSNPIQGQIINMPAGDSIPLSLHLIISPSYYDIGPDILVVWPIIRNGNGAPTIQRIDSQIVVQAYGTGLKDLQDNKGVDAYSKAIGGCPKLII